MRATMYQYLAAQVSMSTLVPVARWYQAGAVKDTPVKPFVVLRWLAPVTLAAGFGHQLRVDVHDVRGSYATIDAFKKATRAALGSLAQLTGSDGRITQCDYLGHGGDQEDEIYLTNFSFTSWQVIGVEA